MSTATIVLYAVFIGSGYFIQKAGIHWAKKLQFGQNIHDLTPEAHQKKKGTPSMGGMFIFINIVLGMLLCVKEIPKEIVFTLIAWALFGGIGFIDDIKSIRSGKNKGLSAKEKFTMQWVAAIIFVICFAKFCTPLSVVEMGLMAFLMVGMSNATNLTDGLDGLLTGLSVISFIGLFFMVKETQATHLRESLGIIIIALLIFLKFNAHKARVFMGDTGSLAIGSALVVLCAASGNLFWSIPLGAVYILETVSVMIQVGVYKKTNGKRVFLMTPLHHHFELLGLKETQIVPIFWWIGALCALIGIVF